MILSTSRLNVFALMIIQLLLGSSLVLPSAFAQEEPHYFVVQKGTPIGLQNFAQVESGCNWSGIGGQVFDRNGIPLKGLVIKLSGTLEGSQILSYAVTGGAQQFGPGGYLFSLSDHPVASNGLLRLQVLDVSGNQKTPPIQLYTYGDCERNLYLINIMEIPFRNPLFFPLVGK